MSSIENNPLKREKLPELKIGEYITLLRERQSSIGEKIAVDRNTLQDDEGSHKMKAWKEYRAMVEDLANHLSQLLQAEPDAVTEAIFDGDDELLYSAKDVKMSANASSGVREKLEELDEIISEIK